MSYHESRQEILQRYAEEEIADYDIKGGLSLKRRLEELKGKEVGSLEQAKWISAQFGLHSERWRGSLEFHWEDVQYGSRYGEAFNLADLILAEIRKQLDMKWAREKAHDIGLHYWPAIYAVMQAKEYLEKFIECELRNIEWMQQKYDTSQNPNFKKYIENDRRKIELRKAFAGVNFEAFVIAEGILLKRPERRPWNVASKGGGWDRQGHYGLTPEEVAGAWFVAGSSDNRKFRFLIRGLDEERAPTASSGSRVRFGTVGHIATGASKIGSERMARLVPLVRAERWLDTHGHRLGLDSECFGKAALIFLGRLRPLARAAVLEKVAKKPDGARLNVLDLNLDNLQKFKRLVKMEEGFEGHPLAFDKMSFGKPPMSLQEQAAGYASPRHSWQVLLRQEPPKGLEKFPAYGLSLKFFKELLEVAKETHREEEILIPCYNLAVLFKNQEQINQYRKAAGKKNTNLHDLGQFVLPKKGYWSIDGWRGFVMRNPGAIEKAGFFSKVEEVLRRAHPTGPLHVVLAHLSLKNFNGMVAVLIYENVGSHGELAALCHRKGVEQAVFARYQALMERGKDSDAIPHICLTGADINLPNGEEWVFRKLDSKDPLGPLLGLYTDCCQHLDGVASSCAEHGVTSPWSGFYVVEHKGSLVAQSWAWRGAEEAVEEWGGKSGRPLVFDSVEMLGEDMTRASIVAQLYFAAAQKLKGQLCVSRVLVGDDDRIGGQLRALGKHVPEDDRAVLTGTLYTDANTQYVLCE